ncbi:MAG: hypothetical protein ACRDE2_15110, partial [Chitinophagaceae bacterium]
MPLIKRLFFILLTCGTFYLPSQAQKWTQAQKEVWETVQAYNNLFKEGNYKGILSYMDKDYAGWPFGSEAPVSKSELIKSFSQNTGEVKALSRKITPLLV